jgi:hypothetical protein
MQPSSVSGQPTTRASGNGDGEARTDARAGGDLELAGAGPEPARAGEQGRPGQLAAAGDDEQAAALLLVAVVGMVGEREAAQQAPVQDLELAHRAATMASGSEVIGASSSISGAAKL